MSGLGAYFILGSGVNIAIFSALLRWTPVLEELRRTASGQVIPPNADLAGMAGVTLIMGVLLAVLGGVWLVRLALKARRATVDQNNGQARPPPQGLKAFFYAILSFAFFPVPLLLRILQTAEDPALMARLSLDALQSVAGLWSVLKLSPLLSLVGLFLLIWLISWRLLRWAHSASRRPQPGVSAG